MQINSALICAAIIISSAAVLGSAPALAQDRPTTEGVRLQGLCEGGDRRACVRFGMLLNENRGRHEEWRKSHPEFWSYHVASEKSGGGSAGGGTGQPWCGVPYSSTRECVYQTIAQCESDLRPLGGDCVPRD
jgi:hypothetical protein